MGTVFTSIDFLSSTFQFDIGQKQKRKKNFLGACLSLFVLVLITAYTVYQILLYANNQIDPKFIQQNYITEDAIDLVLHENLVAYRYEYTPGASLDDLQRKTNQTYLVFLPYFMYQNNTQYDMIQLNIVECSDNKLKGYNCLDFSSVSNYTLNLYALESILSRIYILAYQCQDTDAYKATVPNNCASVEDVDKIVNDPASSLHLKLYTSQYNTTSQNMQENFRNSYLNLQGNQFLYSIYKVKKQITNIKSGNIIQKKSSHSSPIEYQLQNQNFDRQTFVQKTGLQLILQISIEMDEIIQHIQIQYPTFPEVLAVCNSALALLMCIGILTRKFGSQLIYQDIFLLFLQNIYQGTFQKMLKLDKQLFKNEDIQTEKEIQDEDHFFDQDSENVKPINVPDFQNEKVQSIVKLNQSMKNKIAEQSIIKDTIKEQSEINADSFNLQLLNLCLNKSNYSPLKVNDKIMSYQNTLSFDDKKLVSSPCQLKSVKNKSLSYFNKTNTLNQQNIQDNTTKIIQKQKTNFSEFCSKSQKIDQVSSYKSNLSLEQSSYTSIFNISSIQKIQKMIFGIRFKRKEYLDQGLDETTKKNIEDQVIKNMDILQIYRDMIFLKKAVFMLLSKEQLAAVKLVGCSSKFYQNLQNQKIEKQSNYFEEQIQLLESNEISYQLTKNFLIRSKYQNSNFNEVDQRILSSLCIDQKHKF